MRDSSGERAFFGRRHGKTLRAGQAEALARVLPLLKLDLDAAPPDPLRRMFGSDVRKIRLEIGFGGGEHLLYRVKHEPDCGFIGIEPFVNGMAKLVSAIAEDQPENLRIYDDDATRLLDWLPPGSIAGIDLLYPDPWPKRRHWKRRFIRPENLDRIARVLSSGGQLRFASDIDSYVNWTLLRMRDHGSFEWLADTADDWHSPFPGWPGTRYEAKAMREGRRPAYLTFRRC